MKIKFKDYKEFDGCPKCGGYDYESTIEDFDFFTHKGNEYVAMHHVVNCNCGYQYTFDEIYKYYCDAMRK